jgi:hypothetical protein
VRVPTLPYGEDDEWIPIDESIDACGAPAATRWRSCGCPAPAQRDPPERRDSPLYTEPLVAFVQNRPRHELTAAPLPADAAHKLEACSL